MPQITYGVNNSGTWDADYQTLDNDIMFLVMDSLILMMLPSRETCMVMYVNDSSINYSMSSNEFYVLLASH